MKAALNYMLVPCCGFGKGLALFLVQAFENQAKLNYFKKNSANPGRIASRFHSLA
jgi:hypothetical protein